MGDIRNNSAFISAIDRFYNTPGHSTNGDNPAFLAALQTIRNLSIQLGLSNYTSGRLRKHIHGNPPASSQMHGPSVTHSWKDANDQPYISVYGRVGKQPGQHWHPSLQPTLNNPDFSAESLNKITDVFPGQEEGTCMYVIIAKVPGENLRHIILWVGHCFETEKSRKISREKNWMDRLRQDRKSARFSAYRPIGFVKVLENASEDACYHAEFGVTFGRNLVDIESRYSRDQLPQNDSVIVDLKNDKYADGFTLTYDHSATELMVWSYTLTLHAIQEALEKDGVTWK